MITIARLTIGEAARRRVLWVLVILAARRGRAHRVGRVDRLVTVARASGTPASSRSSSASPRSSSSSRSMFGFVLAMTAAFLGSPAIAGDLESGIAQALLARPLRRSSYLLGPLARPGDRPRRPTRPAGSLAIVVVGARLGLHSPPDPILPIVVPRRRRRSSCSRSPPAVDPPAADRRRRDRGRRLRAVVDGGRHRAGRHRHRGQQPGRQPRDRRPGRACPAADRWPLARRRSTASSLASSSPQRAASRWPRPTRSSPSSPPTPGLRRLGRGLGRPRHARSPPSRCAAGSSRAAGRPRSRTPQPRYRKQPGRWSSTRPTLCMKE